MLCGEESLDVFIPLMRLGSKIFIGNGFNNKWQVLKIELIQILQHEFSKEHHEEGTKQANALVLPRFPPQLEPLRDANGRLLPLAAQTQPPSPFTVASSV